MGTIFIVLKNPLPHIERATADKNLHSCMFCKQKNVK